MKNTYSRDIMRHAIFYVCLAQLGAAHGSEYSQTIHVGLDLHAFHYKEYDARGHVLDREDGVLPGLKVGFEARSGLYGIAIFAAAWNGTVEYDGQTQAGSPLTATSDATITDYRLAFSRGISSGANQAAVPARLIAEIGTRRWDRKIRSTARTNSLYEVYRWPYYRLGGEISLSETDKLSVGAKALAGRTFSSSLEVHIKGYDTTTLDLKPGNSFHLSIPVSYRWRPKRSLLVEPYFDYWHFDESSLQPLSRNGVSVGLVQEPENETSSFGITLSTRF